MPPKPGTGKRRRLQDVSEMVRLKLLNEQLNHPLPQSPPPPPPRETQPGKGKRKRLQGVSEMVRLKLLHKSNPLPPPPPLETQPSPPEIAALTSKTSSPTISPLPSIQNQSPPPSPPPLYAIHSPTTSVNSVTSSSATVRSIQFKELQLNSASQPEIDELRAKISSLETADKKLKSKLARNLKLCRVIMKQCQVMGVEHPGLQEAIEIAERSDSDEEEEEEEEEEEDDEEELSPASSQVGPSMYEVGLNGPSGSALPMISTPGSWHPMLSNQGHKKGKAVVDDDDEGDDEVSSDV